MIGLDTNVIIRYLTQDDKKKAALATKLFEHKLSHKAPGFISLVVIVEVVWVLEACYNVEKKQLVEILESLLSSRQLVVERADLVRVGIKLFVDSGADFSDALVVAISNAAGCKQTVTFDKKALSVGMTSL